MGELENQADVMKKCVIIVDESLPIGLIANTAAILGYSLGKMYPESIGPDVPDGTGNVHSGLITYAVPILKSSSTQLWSMRNKLFSDDYRDLAVVDFPDAAQRCRTYDDFTKQLAGTSERDLRYLGIAIYGDRKKVNRLTGEMPLLR
jgi:hypothetical protein